MRPSTTFIRNLQSMTLLATVVVAVSVLSFGQSTDTPSLGELARKHRQEQAKQASAKPKKVVTNEDLPKHSETLGDGSDADVPSHRFAL